ncbi:MAG: signal peptidase I [Solirubrobacteraceae bacterium]
MKPPRLRSALLTGALLLLAGAAWFYLAPTAIGGSTAYVVTSGTSMEPRFHTDDLAIVRPASQYRVGDVVAYHSTLLHVITLHRIVAIHDGRYTFKGDNNDFRDPTHPTRALLIGKLWLHLPGGGVVLRWLHKPVSGALLAGLLGLILVGGTGERRRRGRRHERRGSPGRPGAPGVNPPTHPVTTSVDLRAVLAGCGVAAAVFAALVLVGLTAPLKRATTRKVSYSQQLALSYRGAVRPSPVYPNGVITTGEPVFLALAHRIEIRGAYRFQTDAPASLRGVQSLSLRLTGPTGWTRTIPLAAPRRFSGTNATTSAWLDLASLQALLNRVQRLTGSEPGSDFGLTMIADVQVGGRVAQIPLHARISPSLSLQLTPQQLQPSGSTSTQPSGSGQSASTTRTQGSVQVPATAANTLGVGPVSLSVSMLRLLALVGLALSLAGAGIAALLLRRRGPFDEAARIQARYGHMLVKIATAEDLGWPPVDVASIKALVRLAESSGQMILHSHDDAADIYLVNDNGSVYRYRAVLPKVAWGEWTETAASPLSVASDERDETDPPAELAA